VLAAERRPHGSRVRRERVIAQLALHAPDRLVEMVCPPPDVALIRAIAWAAWAWSPARRAWSSERSNASRCGPKAPRVK
jgi:hypothetical protein